MRWNRPGAVIVAVALTVTGAVSVRAGYNEIIQAIAESDFDFQRKDSELPGIPLGWLRATRYQGSAFDAGPGLNDSLAFDQADFSHGMFLPVAAAKRDILVVGYYYGHTRFDFRRRLQGDDSGEINRFAGAAAWFHQVNTNWMAATFAVPYVQSSLDGGDPWATDWYVGSVARYYYKPAVQVLMGGVYIRSYGENLVYPYLGAIWMPTPSLAVTAVFPWPSVSYAISRSTMVRLGASPSGAQWLLRDNDSANADFGGWDLGLTAEHRLVRSLWLAATVGWSGMRALRLSEGGQTDYETNLDDDPFVSLALMFRP